jgi:hypothetical protein
MLYTMVYNITNLVFMGVTENQFILSVTTDDIMKFYKSMLSNTVDNIIKPVFKHIIENI